MTAITVLDGGLGQELVRRSAKGPTALWSTRVMIDNPGLVETVHRDFFSAGATIATTNTYAILRDRLQMEDIEDQFEPLLAAALSEARAARAAHGSGRIAGAIGPLAATYRPDLHPPVAEAIPAYAEIATLIAPGCDLLICETVASLTHAEAILAGARAGGKPVWLSITVNDHDGTCLRSGEPVAEVLPLADNGGAAALLVNCSMPEAIADALPVLARGALPFGAYANGFTGIAPDFLKTAPTVDALSARQDLGPEAYATHVMGWIDAGATIVGGCCEVGPAHIAAITDRLRAAGHTRV
ncbi:homocysteine S-methyltransferase family protein [Cognatishimia sp. F0-27]|uniref:homocysteine S-methyltransferase family protein n=1 Tax=Cognatishimia sp. F0-27 TaxID=2816855 RepID=UPI001D0CD32A|nr:homocysteine S-methyltransferase family protein [Cognatishimia sp. F0-27]MCC1492118.1 homocysteine S-methyltransferase family protein [Cognatishimia sp. F0-27]